MELVCNVLDTNRSEQQLRLVPSGQRLGQLRWAGYLSSTKMHWVGGRIISAAVAEMLSEYCSGLKWVKGAVHVKNMC